MVALLVMGVLLAISLALSSLIFRETVSTRELLNSGRAYYAAESAVEEALFYLDNELPGWDSDGKENLGKVGDYSAYEYMVKNKCNSYPCFDKDEYDYATMKADKFYGILELNEAVTIPLFSVENGEIASVKDFTVEFFANFNPSTDLEGINIDNISGWDILRWKVYGMKQTNEGFVTDSIHDFTAVSSIQQKSDIETKTYLSSASTPSWFGSRSCGGMSVGGKIKCNEYKKTALTVDNVVCSQLEARDFYLYNGDEFQAKLPCYSIKTFLENSQPGVGGSTGLNYLTLTNLMNPGVLKSSVGDKNVASRLYYRVETYDDEIPREYADIVATGYSGNLKQSISVQIKKDSYMPVFNFSLYSTYKEGDASEFYNEEDL